MRVCTWMCDNSQLAVCLLDLQLGGIGLHAQGIIVCRIYDHGGQSLSQYLCLNGDIWWSGECGGLALPGNEDCLVGSGVDEAERFLRLKM
jgi:hypothetical protein